MRFTNLWSRVTGGRSKSAQSGTKKRSAVRFAPALTPLEDRTVMNGYLAIGAGPGSFPLVAIRVDIHDAVGGSLPNSSGQPASPRSDGQTDFTSQIFMAYNQGFRGGVNVATGNFDGNPLTPDSLVTAPKGGGGPHVIVWNTQQNADGTIVVTGIKQQFMAFDPRFTGGVNIACGDLDGDGKAELICAAGPGGGPHVRVFSPDANGFFHLATEFFAYDARFRGGVSLASGQGYNTPVQVLQDLPNLQALPAVITPYPAGEPVPGAAQGIPLITIDPNTSTPGNIIPAITVAGGNLQYLSANFLNNYGQIAYRPDIFIPPPLPNPNNIGHLVYANWANTMASSNYPTDGSNPPTGVTVGPYVQIGVGANNTPIITRLTPPPGQQSTRNQLVTGAGPGGGPDVRVWSFTGSGSALHATMAKQFFAFAPTFRGGVNVAIGDVIGNPEPTTAANGQQVVEPLGYNPATGWVFDPITGLPFQAERTDNSGLPGVDPVTRLPIPGTAPSWPFNTDVFRRYEPSILVGMASGGSLVRIFSDFNPAVSDPNNPFSDVAPALRSSVTEINLVPALIDRGVITNLSNPLGGFTGLGSTTFFNRGISPQFTGGINPTVTAFTFAGKAGNILVGENLFNGPGGPGTTPNSPPWITNPVLGQTVLAAGSGAGGSSRSLISIFNQMSEIDITSGMPPSVSSARFSNPVDGFSGFNSFSGAGVTVSFGFGSLPIPSLDQVSLPSITPPTVTNPILV